MRTFLPTLLALVMDLNAEKAHGQDDVAKIGAKSMASSEAIARHDIDSMQSFLAESTFKKTMVVGELQIAV